MTPLPSPIRAMIRVNHAGEYGAKRIYAGQLAILGDTTAGPALREMAAQEEDHLKAFEDLILEHEVRPSVLQPLWYVGGYAMGALTALMGEKAAHACTIAVEEVIDDHYKDQLKQLGSDHPSLADLIEKCRQDEVHHKEMAEAHGGREAPAYSILEAVIKGISRTAIKIAERI